MTAFDKNLKHKKMPQTPENMTTVELLDAISPYLLNPAIQYYNELLYRKIQKDDPDDVVVNGVAQTRGGVRPAHTPIVP